VRVRLTVLCFITFVLFINIAPAQSPNGTVSGIVLDPSGGIIAGADVLIINGATGVQYAGKANNEGFYVAPNIPPGTYRIQVSNSGFKTIIKPDIIIHVQDALAINFTLPIGAASEIVTVEGGAPLIDAESAAVSTVVDRQFADNLPMNGRSFQTLIQLTPGVVLSPSTGADPGQFSVNGQRTNSNYWMVDGVSANVGSSVLFGGSGLAGSVGTYSVFGGTNSLVSVDALQEFRIQTSTYAPEFGRTPGGQISIVTRSGTNQLHGTLFEYFRNDILDANNWFNTSVTPALPKAEERQNNFGGTFAGPILKDKTFFFFSYEGLRLRLPQTQLAIVPDTASVQGGISARENAIPGMQPFLNAFPLPNGPEIFTPCDPATDQTCPASRQKPTGTAQFNSSFSNPATLDAYSLRIDHKLNDKLAIFGRYNHSPSEIHQRGMFGSPLSTAFDSNVAIQTATVGSTWIISPGAANDLRFNYSRTNASTEAQVDSFAGAVPLPSLSFPSPYTDKNARLILAIFPLGANLQAGALIRNLQRQLNAIDSVSAQVGSHTLKFGADYRRLSPVYSPYRYQQTAYILDIQSAESGTLLASKTQSNVGTTLLLNNFSAYMQDTWRVVPRMTVTYGLRWDVDFAPYSAEGASFPAVTGFDLKDLSALALAPAGAASFKTSFGNLAPRLGIAYKISQKQESETVVRGGFGVFYDLASSEIGNLINQAGYPFTASSPLTFGGTFPLSPTSAAAAPPIIAPPNATNQGSLTAFDPRLRLPYSLEWNAAVQHQLGRYQTVSASYIGSIGRRLLQTANIFSPNPNYGQAFLVSNSATSDYSALQLQFQRQLSQGLQALASYTWSHSIDDASAGSLGDGNGGANNLVVNPNANRGPSDFDIRNQFSLGLTYDIPVPKSKPFIRTIVGGWSTENFVLARTAPPVNVYNGTWGLSLSNAATAVRPDVVSGQPLYLSGAQYPGGKAINPAAFVEPPTDSNGNPLRQGDLGRNALRGFGAFEWDFAVHREFPLHESIRLQFRAEMFNVLNHPSFAPPDRDLSRPQFGKSTELLGQYLSGGNLGGGGFNPLYQIGGPRSIQFALKLMF
jgi:hypothetical protein